MGRRSKCCCCLVTKLCPIKDDIYIWPTGLQKETTLTVDFRDIQTKTTMRYHHTVVRMAIIKKSTNKCWRECGEKGTLTLLVGTQIDATTMEDNLEVPQKKLN